MIPTYDAIALALILLSPVTIRVFIPALRHFFIASYTYGRGISLIPSMAIKIKPFF